MGSFMTSNVINLTSDAKTDTISDSPTNAASRAKQNTIPDGLSSKSSPHPADGASGVSALQTITSRVVRQCDNASYHLLQVFGMIRRRRRLMSFDNQ